MENLCVCFLFCFQQLALSFALDFIASSSSSFYLRRGNPSLVLNGSLTPSSLILLPSSNIHPLPCLSEIITARLMTGPSTVIDVRRLVLFQRFAFFTNTKDRCLFFTAIGLETRATGGILSFNHYFTWNMTKWEVTFSNFGILCNYKSRSHSRIAFKNLLQFFSISFFFSYMKVLLYSG